MGNIIVRGEIHYKTDSGTSRSVLQTGKSLTSLNPEPIPVGTVVKSVKLKDVESLLKTHFGNEWDDIPELQFYKAIFQGENLQIPNDANDNIDEPLADDVCAPRCEDYELII